MRPSQKLAISLLIATLLFGAFSFFAFSGLFPLIETHFFSPRIVRELQNSLESGEKIFDEYKKRTKDGLNLMLEEDFFKNIFNPTQSKEDISRQFNSLRLYLKGFRGKAAFRIVDSNYNRVHFSSQEEDLLDLTANSVSYKAYGSSDQWPESLALGKLSQATGDLVFRDLGVRIHQKGIADDVTGLLRGYALLSVSLEDEGFELFQQGIIPDRTLYKPISKDITVISFNNLLTAEVLDQVESLYGKNPEESIRYLTKDAMRLVMITDPKRSTGWVLIAPASLLELNEILKLIILLSIFTLSFLPIFILLNLRAEPEVIWSKKIKKMQVQILTGFLDQGKVSPKDAAKALLDNSQGIKAQLRKVLGKVKKSTRPIVDELIDKSWEEILNVLGVQGQSPPGSSSTDIERIEKLLKEALARGAISVSVPPQQDNPEKVPKVVKKKVSESPGSKVEDLEELEEIGDDEESEDLEELEEIDDATNTDEVEDLEELEELEEIGDTEKENEPEDLEELEEIGDAEESEELEELTELEEMGEAENSDEPEALEELVEILTDDEAEELEELNEAVEPPGDETLVELLPEAEERDLEYLENDEDHTSSGTILEPLIEPQDFYLYPGIGSHNKPLGDDLKVIGGAELIPIGEEVASDPQFHMKSFTMDEVASYYKDMSHSFLVEDQGVFSISSEAYNRTHEVQDSEFTQLIDDVVHKNIGPHTFILEGESQNTPERIWNWSADGFDMDLLLQGYRGGDLGIYKSIVDLSSGFEAVGIAVLEKDENGYFSQYSVGFSDSGKKNLLVGSDSPFAQEILMKSGIHILDGRYKASLIHTFLDKKDLKFVKALVVLPIRFHSQGAHLILTMKNYPAEILDRLSPKKNIH